MLFRRAYMLGLILCNTPEGGGGGGGGTPPNPPAPPAQPKSLSHLVSRMVQRHGTAETALAVLLGEQHDNRVKLRERDARIATLEGSAPKGDQLVLSKEQRADWEAYQALGKPADVKAKLDLVPTLQAKVAERDGEDLVSEALTHTGYKSKTVLADLLKVRDLALEIKEEKGAGDKMVKVAYVKSTKPEDKDKPAILLTKYVDESAADYKVALGQASGTPAPPAPRGVRLPAGGGADGKAKTESTGDKVADRLEARKRRDDAIKGKPAGAAT